MRIGGKDRISVPAKLEERFGSDGPRRTVAINDEDRHDRSARGSLQGPQSGRQQEQITQLALGNHQAVAK